MVEADSDSFEPIRRPFPITSLALFMTNCATKSKSKGCSVTHSEGNKSNLGPLEAQLLWRFLKDLRLKISRDLGIDVDDNTEVPLGISTMYQLLMVDLAFFKSELKKLKYKKGREGERWLGDPFDPESPYIIPDPRLIAICNSMVYVAAQIYMGSRKRLNNMSLQNSTAVGINVMRGGATKILSWFANHPNSPYYGDSMFEVLESMYDPENHCGFLPLDIKSMEKAVDEAVKYLKFRTDLYHLEIPEVWTWMHEKYFFLHAMVAEHAIHPVLCVGKTGTSLSLPTSLMSGGPCTTILGEFYQKLLVTDASYQMYIDYLKDKGEKPIILNLNYSDDAVLHVSNLPPEKLLHYLSNTGAEFNFEDNNFDGEGNLIYIPMLSTDRRNPEGVTFLKMYFVYENGNFYFFRVAEDMLAKFFYAADGIRDVSHYARRLASQAYQMGHNIEMYELLKGLYEDLTGGLPTDLRLYGQEESSYIRAAGGIDFPSFQAVLVLQKPTQRHIDAHLVQSLAARNIIPGALFL